MRVLHPLLLIAFVATAADINYSYDSAGRLIKVDYGNGSAISYTYDKAGNLTARSAQSSSGPVISSVTTAFGGPNISQNDWIAIQGSGLVPASTPDAGMSWNNAPDFASGKLPTALAGVSVTVDGKPAFISFYCRAGSSVCPASDQINALTPLDAATGQVQVMVANGASSSPNFSVNMQAAAPSFLLFSSAGYIVATHANGTLLGPTNLYPGLSTPAKPGETIVLYGVGFGLPSTPLTNGSSSQTGSLSTLPVCQFGSGAANVGFAGLISPGLYQLNVTVPAGTPNGDSAVVCSYNGTTTPPGDLITVQQ